jgi:hypothetical protein
MAANEATGSFSAHPSRRRNSAVSQALRALKEEVERPPATWRFTDRRGGTYRIFPATDRAARERAYALTQRLYRNCGYVSGEESAEAPCPAAFDPRTFTLLAEDERGQPAGTVSLVFDSSEGLPCDEIYRDELDLMRAQGRRLVEVTRLAIGEEHARSRLLLVHLFEFIYIFAWHVRRHTDFVIEVNPRHADFYRRLLLFEEAGPVRPCPRVRDAPAKLLRLDLGFGERQVEWAHGPDSAGAPKTLHRCFHPPVEEMRIKEFLQDAWESSTRPAQEEPVDRQDTPRPTSPRGFALAHAPRRRP